MPARSRPRRRSRSADLYAGDVFERAAELAARLLGRVLESPSFAPQPEDGAIYAEKIAPADRELDLDDPLDAWRRVRALSPHIGAWTTAARPARDDLARAARRRASSCPSSCSRRGAAR